MSGTKLRLVPPPVNDERSWNLVLNCLYGSRKDSLFVWLQQVRAYVEERERERKRGAA